MFREDPELAIRQRREIETEKGDGAEDRSLSAVSSRPPSALKADPELPFLEMAWSPSQMLDFFNHRVLPIVHPHWEAVAVAINDMAYKPGARCEILYSLQLGDPPHGHAADVRGRAERIRLLLTAGLDISEPSLAQQRARLGTRRLLVDDVIDALACLITASAIGRGESHCLGRIGQKDGKDLAMEIVVSVQALVSARLKRALLVLVPPEAL